MPRIVCSLSTLSVAVVTADVRSRTFKIRLCAPPRTPWALPCRTCWYFCRYSLCAFRSITLVAKVRGGVRCSKVCVVVDIVERCDLLLVVLLLMWHCAVLSFGADEFDRGRALAESSLHRDFSAASFEHELVHVNLTFSHQAKIAKFVGLPDTHMEQKRSKKDLKAPLRVRQSCV